VCLWPRRDPEPTEAPGASPRQARDHGRSARWAVFSDLRETVGRKEFDDTMAQLGDDYRLLLK
jgi:hypothetical protein